MRHRVKTIKLNMKASHRKAVFRNLVTSFIEQEKVTTTLAKAKAAQRISEKMITFGKRGDLHARRQVARFVRTTNMIKKLFDEIAPLYKNINGGYTRVIKLNERRGDAAPMAILELTHKTEKKKQEVAKAKEKTKESVAEKIQKKLGKSG